jgi:hypothetical protein
MPPGSTMARRSPAMRRRVFAISGARNHLPDMREACISAIRTCKPPEPSVTWRLVRHSDITSGKWRVLGSIPNALSEPCMVNGPCGGSCSVIAKVHMTNNRRISSERIAHAAAVIDPVFLNSPQFLLYSQKIFQPTIQPTTCDVLCDLQVFWQSPRFL